MPAIGNITRARIREYLETVLTRLVLELDDQEPQTDEYGLLTPQPTLHPFHEVIIPDEIRKLNDFRKRLNTVLDTTFAGVAQFIALEHHAEAKRAYEFRSIISNDSLIEIDKQALLFERAVEANDDPPLLSEMIDAVLRIRNQGEVSEKTAHADLFIRTHDDKEFFFDIRPPLPDKNECYLGVSHILYHHLMRGLPRPQVQSYFAMAYNPYGPEREDYRWSVAKMYLPFEQATLVGHEFWDIVGGPTAYEELMDIYHEVGRDKSKHIIDSLAFGF